MTHDVFISHSSRDRGVACSTCEALEASGIKCWIAPRDIPAGADWSESIVTALDECRAVVLIFSAHTNLSSHVRSEIRHAASRSIGILTIRLEDVALRKSLAFFTADMQWIDATQAPLARHLVQVPAVLRGLLDENETAPVPQAPAGPRRALLGERLVTVLAMALVVGVFWMFLNLRDLYTAAPKKEEARRISDVPAFAMKSTVFFREPVVLQWTYGQASDPQVLYEIQGAETKDFANAVAIRTDGTSWPVRDRPKQRWWRVRALINERWTQPSQPIKTTYYKDSYDRIGRTGVLAVSVSSDISQGIFKFVHETRREGVDIDIVRAIAADLEHRFHRRIAINVSSTTWDKLFVPLRTGSADLVVAAVTKMTSREAKFHVRFSETYFCTGKSLLYNKKVANEIRAGTPLRKVLEGKAVGYGVDTASEVVMKRLQGEDGTSSFRIVPFSEVEEPVERLLTPGSDIQFAVTDTTFAVARVLDDQDGALASAPLSNSDFPSSATAEERRDQYAIAVDERETALLGVIDTKIVEMKQTGELPHILRHAARLRFPAADEPSLALASTSECGVGSAKRD